MEDYNHIVQTISLAMGAAWASGLNLYATILVLGIGAATGSIVLPQELGVLASPAVIGAAGLMYVVEFFADKTPGVDTGWDGIHTFLRIPAGAVLAAGAVGDVAPELAIAAGLIGGAMAASTHAAKAGSRVMINASPEPFSNWAASFTEDLLVLGGIWAALNHPFYFLAALVLFILLMVWLLPRLYRCLQTVFHSLQKRAPPGPPGAPDGEPPGVVADDESLERRLHRLRSLRERGALDQSEYEAARDKLLKTL